MKQTNFVLSLAAAIALAACGGGGGGGNGNTSSVAQLSSSSGLSSSNTSTTPASSLSSSAASIGVSSSEAISNSLSSSSEPASSSSSSSSASVDFASCDNFNTPQGYAADGGIGVTGGADAGLGNQVITVTNGMQLNNALSATNAIYKDKPLVIYIGGTITWENSGNAEIRVRRSNVSIIGLAASGEFHGVGIRISHGASNIIIRNLLIHEVPQARGAGDHINLDGQNGAVSRIWIDHNEFYNDLAVTVPVGTANPDEYQKDYYDELVSGRSRVHNVTISYNYLHKSWKTSLWGSSDNAVEEDVGRTISFHHNYWKDVNSRLPLFRFGEGHVWNSYYQNVSGSGINSRMGAKIRVDNNVFENVKNALWSGDSSAIGFWNATGNTFTNPSWSGSFNASCTTPPCYAGGNNSNSDFVPPYAYNVMATVDVKTHVMTYAGRNKIANCLNLPETNASSSSQASSESSSLSSAVPAVTKTWGYDSDAFATVATDLFAANYSATADNNIKAAADIDVDGLYFYSTAANVLRYRPAGSANNATLLPWWNTNGSFFTSNSVMMPAVGEALPNNVRTYIAIPVATGKAFTITINFKQTGSAATAAKIALAGSDNLVLAIADATYAIAGGDAGSSITVSGDASHQLTSIKFLYGREGLSTGGVNITQIDRLQ